MYLYHHTNYGYTVPFFTFNTAYEPLLGTFKPSTHALNNCPM